MKKYIKMLIILLCLVIVAGVARAVVSAEDSGPSQSPSVTALPEGEPDVIEAVETEVHIDEEIASEVVDIVVNADNKNEAILNVAQKVGVDVNKAEAIVDSIIETGDLYFGEDAWWAGFKEDIIANKNFWITVVLCILCGIAILGMIFVFVAKVVPILNKSNFGMNEMFKLSSGMQEANSQTLGKIEELAARVAEKDEAYNKLLAEKEEHIEKLVERIAEMKAAAEKERRSMVLAESYNLQILKLICSRTALPLADKAAIDLWYTKAMESLKSELSVEDIKKIENVAATLEVSDGKAV